MVRGRGGCSVLPFEIVREYRAKGMGVTLNIEDEDFVRC